MNVQAMLKAKGDKVYSTAPEIQLEDVTRSLGRYKVGSLVVLDDANELVGIISERDIVRAIAGSGSAALKKKTSDVMTRQVVTCGLTDTVQELMEMMTAGHFRHLPVVNDSGVVGVISIGDVVKRRIEEAELEAQSMRAYIATG